MSRFPAARSRRLRRNDSIRRMVREHALNVEDLIYPLFVVPGKNIKKEIPSLPKQFHYSVDRIVEAAQEAADLGILAVLIFGLPEVKSPVGEESYHDHGVAQAAIKAIKQAIPKLTVITDVCLCSYTDHGHCGPVGGRQEEFNVLNDPTLEIISKIAVSHAKAGADIVAPSGMMDGMVSSIRTALDQAGYHDVAILSYSVKYASAFYGPFRLAVDSAHFSGDRKSYQMDPANIHEGWREAELDIEEGADMLMVKPALAYLDVIYSLKQRYAMPLVAYNVSGEYSMIKAAAKEGLVDEKSTALESLTAMKRAGADLIITYFAKDVAVWLK
ncbi:MAG: Porphobilinogen synthase [Gammaproteobacteria bacterium]|jgi:porphobilinogen synthase|nr:Porphobilinogen synthase [Gammaproteobacteria bacterium]